MGQMQAITPLLERSASGLVHLLLQASIQHTPLASLSRPIAGTIGSTLVVTLPGSPKAVKENITALLNGGVVIHALELIKGGNGKEVHRALGVPERNVVADAASVPSTVRPSDQQTREGHDHTHHHHHHHHRHDHDIPTPKSHDPSLGGGSNLLFNNRILPTPFGHVRQLRQGTEALHIR